MLLTAVDLEVGLFTGFNTRLYLKGLVSLISAHLVRGWSKWRSPTSESRLCASSILGRIVNSLDRNAISGKAAVALHSCYSIFWFMRSTFLIGGVDIPPPRSCLVLLSYFAWLVEILDHCFFMWGDWLYVTTVCGSTVNWNALSFGIVVGCFMLQQLFCVIIWMKIESV